MDFTMREENFFITYDDIIKSSAVAVMSEIVTKYMDNYKEFLDFSPFIANSTTEDFIQTVLNRRYFNPLEAFRSRNFDFETAYEDLIRRNSNLYDDSTLLVFGQGIPNLVRQNFTNKIYIWSEVYDERIHRDLDLTFGLGDSVKYITGDFSMAVNEIDGITCYVLNQAKYVYDIINVDRIRYTNILLANNPYNYKVSELSNETDKLTIEDLGELIPKYKFKLAMMRVF